MTIILTTEELERVTGYKTPKRQVQELHRQGFYRARRWRCWCWRVALRGMGWVITAQAPQAHGCGWWFARSNTPSAHPSPHR